MRINGNLDALSGFKKEGKEARVYFLMRRT